MKFEKLKALLKSGAITEAQFQAMCEKFGFEVETEDETGTKGKAKEKKNQTNQRIVRNYWKRKSNRQWIVPQTSWGTTTKHCVRN